jgi:hypothetical protein
MCMTHRAHWVAAAVSSACGSENARTSLRRPAPASADHRLGLSPELLDDRDDAPYFFFCADGISARSGGLAPDIDDSGALLDHAYTVGNSSRGVEKLPAVREGIRGDIEHAHDHGPLQVESLRSTPHKQHRGANAPMPLQRSMSAQC